MGTAKTGIDLFENYSYVRGASRVGNVMNETLSSTISFHPVATSTSTKSGKDIESETYCLHRSRRFHLSVSSLTTEDDQKNRSDTSSLGVLRIDDVRTSWDAIQSNGIGEQPERVTSGWNISTMQQDGLPNFSNEFGLQEIQNNLEFIAKEESRNKAEHPFIQEEVMNIVDGKYDTSSWNVSQALEVGDERTNANLQTSSQSVVSVSSFFKRRSASLGNFEGNTEAKVPSPNFGLPTRKHKNATQSPPPDSVISKGLPGRNRHGALGASYGAFNSGCEDTIIDKNTNRNRPAASPEVNHHHSDQRNQIGAGDSRWPHFDAKPPRVPLKIGRPASVVDALAIDTMNEKSIHSSGTDMNNSSRSMTSLQEIDYIIKNMPDGLNSSTLAKKILSVTNRSDKSKKDQHGQVKPNRDTATATDRNKTSAARMKETVAAAKDSDTVPCQLPQKEQDCCRSGSHTQTPKIPDRAPRESITLAVIIDGITYKGTLYAQSTNP